MRRQINQQQTKLDDWVQLTQDTPVQLKKLKKSSPMCSSWENCSIFNRFAHSNCGIRSPSLNLLMPSSHGLAGAPAEHKTPGRLTFRLKTDGRYINTSERKWHLHTKRFGWNAAGAECWDFQRDLERCRY